MMKAIVYLNDVSPLNDIRYVQFEETIHADKMKSYMNQFSMNNGFTVWPELYKSCESNKHIQLYIGMTQFIPMLEEVMGDQIIIRTNRLYKGFEKYAIPGAILETYTPTYYIGRE